MFPILMASMSSEEDKCKVAHLFTEYRSLMLYIAKGVLKDHALAEDAVSESFVRIIRNIHKVGDVSCHKTRGLVVVIVRNVAISIYNKRVRDDVCYEDESLEVPDPSPGVLDEILGIEGYNNVVDIINALPESLRDVADLAFIHRLDYKEISEILDISYDNVRQRVSRAKNAIKVKLHKHDMWR